MRRVHIPKGTGGDTRPIGIPTFEDKVLQRAVVMLLESVYEQDFHDCSYGFEPRRSAHQALDARWQQSMRINGGWILDVDIRKFFDTLDHAHLRELLQRRMRDGVLLRLIGKWLNAGVLENGNLSYPQAGTPKGGVISPLGFAREYAKRLHMRQHLVYGVIAVVIVWIVSVRLLRRVMPNGAATVRQRFRTRSRTASSRARL